MNKQKILNTIKKYNSFNWVAFYYPRLHKISLNGGKLLNELEAIKEMNESIKRLEVNK